MCQMQKTILNFLLFVLVIPAWAAHPDVKYVDFSGVKHSCHPASTTEYCPRLVYDVPLGIRISLGRSNCLDSIEKNSSTLKEQIRECFLDSILKKFYVDLQLYDVKASCLKRNLEDCKKYELSCGSPPCGELGNFIKEVKNRGLTGFEKVDGEEACNSLVQ